MPVPAIVLQTFSTIIVVLCWLVYVPMFIGRSGPGTERTRQDRSSRWGLVLQYSGAVTVWAWRRPLFSALTGTFPLGVVAPIAAVILAAGSVYFSRIALQTLGKQWSFVAGVKAEHRLIQEGPYSLIRHPLYVCFFGLTLATGVVWTIPAALPIASGLFWLGVWIRVRSEEKILRETFGSEFEDYVKRVPAFFPFL
jgi:protein-S-isoprenylcysteine O-methyltransferase Ste14